MKNLIVITMLSLIMMACVPIPVKALSGHDDSSVTTLVDEGTASVATTEKSESFTAKVAKALGFDIWKLISMAMGLLSIVAGSFWKLAKNKLRQLVDQGALFCDAIEDNNIDANEQTGLVENWKRLISKT